MERNDEHEVKKKINGMGGGKIEREGFRVREKEGRSERLREGGRERRGIE